MDLVSTTMNINSKAPHPDRFGNGVCTEKCPARRASREVEQPQGYQTQVGEQWAKLLGSSASALPWPGSCLLVTGARVRAA